MRITASALALTFMAQGFLTSDALAQDSGAVVTGNNGTEIALSRAQLYRALGDRVVTGNDAIGNNTLNWNQINPSLPRATIGVTLSGGSEAALLNVIRQGCIDAGGTSRACAKVRLRRDRIDSYGGSGVARFDVPAQSVTTYIIPSAPKTETVLPMQPYSMQPIADDVVTRSVQVAPTHTTPPPPPPVPVPVPVSVPQTYSTTTVTNGSGVQTTTVVPAMAITTPQPMIETAPGQVYATRLFLGRDSFPPEAFAAYGILAFNTRAISEDEALYIAICEAFFGVLENSADAPAPKSAQMVTVWPVDDRKNRDLIEDLNITSAENDSCAKAVEFYDLQIAREAIGHAKTAGIPLAGRGPFLLAWSPAGTKGQPDAIVLAADLSDVQNAVDAKDVLRIWREDIEGDRELWQGGFSVEKTRVKLRQIVNRYGDGLLKFFGG